MPRKYTRRAPAEPSPAAHGAQTIPALDQVPAARIISAMEEYGLWLKQNQHITNALPPEPPKSRKVTK